MPGVFSTPGASQPGLAGYGPGPDIGALAAPAFATSVPAGASLDLQFAGTGALDSRITFTRASNATYFDATGTMQTAGSNAARFDHNPATLTPLGLLIENSSTNLLLNSATLSTQSVTGLSATAYTLSFYGTGSVTLSGVATGTLTGTGAATQVTQTFTPAAGALTLTVSGTVSYAQLEQAQFVTSWIPTTGSAASRAADVATMPAGTWYNAVASAFAVIAQQTGTTYHNQAGTSPVSFDNTSSGQSSALNVSGGNSVNMWDQGSVLNSGMGTPAAGSQFKAAFTLRSRYQNGALNGVMGVSAQASVITTGINQLSIGSRQNGNFFNGWIKRIRYWPRVLATCELQAVTT